MKPSKPSPKLQTGSKPSSKRKGRGGKAKPSHKGGSDSLAAKGWLWGQHAITAALANPRRTPFELRATERAASKLNLSGVNTKDGLKILTVSPQELDRFLPQGTAHQGLALRASALPDSDIPTLAVPGEGLILVLDQVTDPQNVGAMFRLAAAFNARGIIMQDRNAPPMAGATAKVAVGTLESVPYALVTNIANTLLELQELGWMVTGLAGEAKLNLSQAFSLPKNATAKANVVVMGAEGPGLRPRVRDCCDQLAKIPMPGGAESLNVSTAAAIALYEASKPV